MSFLGIASKLSTGLGTALIAVNIAVFVHRVFSSLSRETEILSSM
jgi:hypothetical protein